MASRKVAKGVTRRSRECIFCPGLRRYLGDRRLDAGWSDQAESIKTIQRSADAGTNLIDTAPVYGFGHSEEIIGNALAKGGRRDKATKRGPTEKSLARVCGPVCLEFMAPPTHEKLGARDEKGKIYAETKTSAT
jgi:aldo/keto reductase family protein